MMEIEDTKVLDVTGDMDIETNTNTTIIIKKCLKKSNKFVCVQLINKNPLTGEPLLNLTVSFNLWECSTFFFYFDFRNVNIFAGRPEERQ